MTSLEPQLVINHFSHHHPLKLCSIAMEGIACSVCKKEATGSTYSCYSCNYFLHKACSKMPEKLIHKADKNHALTLLDEEGEFVCNACGAFGSGYCYHCAECQLDFHTVCVFMRSVLMSSAHEEHALDLCFEAPYENGVLKCDICGVSGSKSWLYRCELCEFDAHMKCAKATQKTRSSNLEIEQI